MARRRGPVPFPQAQVLAGRAFEAAKLLGLPVEVTLDQFQMAYVKTSRRRVARWNNPEYLRWRAEMLEGDDGDGAPPVSGASAQGVPPPLIRLPPLRAAGAPVVAISPLTDEQVEEAVGDLATARRTGSTTWADAIRERLSLHEVEVVESPEGIRWKRQGSPTPNPYEGFTLDPRYFK